MSGGGSDFLHHLINGLSLGSIYALVAIGYSMVFGILQLINFAHGEVVMLGAVFGVLLAPYLGYVGEPSALLFLQVLVLSMAICGLIGYFIERFAYRPLRNSSRLNCLITAIGVSLFIQYFMQLPFIFGPNPRSFPDLIERKVLAVFAGVEVTSLQVTVFGLSFALMALLQLIVYRTKLGRGMRAVSENTQTAAILGIPVNKVVSFTFVLGSALGAAGGVLVASMYPRVDPLMGSLLGLKAFVAAVLGGIGNIPGAVLGGLLMGVAEQMTVAYISSSFRDAVAFAVLIIVLLIRPSGLLGKTRIEKV